jgi:hypothetical protein
MRYRSGGLILAAIAASMTSTASAQYGYVYIPDFEGMNAGQDAEMACRRGFPAHPSEVSASTLRVTELMKTYWSTVQSGQVPLSSFRLDKHTRWAAGGILLDSKTLASMKDPFAAADNSMEPKPLRFVRAGDGLTAQGQWQVTDAEGRPVGTYKVFMRLKKGDWSISTMDLVDANSWTEPVVQYCHAPGDVLGYRLANAKAAVAEAQRRLTLARQEEASARASADKAKAAAEAAPDNAGKQAAAKSAASKLRAASDVANGYQSQFDTQSAGLAKVEAERAALGAQREAAKSAVAAKPAS